ncbi:unnamed protein product [Linum tenue]|uniref:Uncharacterized protein n=1 Tax=Linum tenue TaxID=586396 RepID=A0AAV0J0F7_9ROSI|nr:unnamed protein product [Linum tenue]
MSVPVTAKDFTHQSCTHNFKVSQKLSRSRVVFRIKRRLLLNRIQRFRLGGLP